MTKLKKIILTNLRKKNCDKTQQQKFVTKLKTNIMTKLKKKCLWLDLKKFDQTKKKIEPKLKQKNCDQSKKKKCDQTQQRNCEKLNNKKLWQN